MVVKTDACFFSELRIYPGHGNRFARKDGKLVAFLNSKTKSLYMQKLKSTKLVWCQAWRRAHKKGISSQTTKRKARKTTKGLRSIAGLSLEDIKKRSTGKHRAFVANEQGARQIKERKKAAEKKKAVKKKVAAPKRGMCIYDQLFLLYVHEHVHWIELFCINRVLAIIYMYTM